MTVKLSRAAYDLARNLVRQGHYVVDDRDEWSEHQPSAQAENEYISEHGFGAYAKWHLGADDEHPRDTKGHYKYPYGDFSAIHRCGVLAAESRAAQRGHEDIKDAAAHLHGMLDAVAPRR